jgi:hypothetical protein
MKTWEKEGYAFGGTVVLAWAFESRLALRSPLKTTHLVNVRPQQEPGGGEGDAVEVLNP